jgi:hypothetical protein
MVRIVAAVEFHLANTQVAVSPRKRPSPRVERCQQSLTFRVSMTATRGNGQDVGRP